VLRRPTLPPPAAIAATVLLLAALAAGCSRPSLRLEETQSFRDADHQQTVEAQVSPDVERLELSLDLEVEGGTVAFEVLDPLGTVVWRGDVTSGGRLADSRDFTPIEGRWRLDLDLQAASGRYEARWVGR